MSDAAYDIADASAVSLAAFAADEPTAALVTQVAGFHWPGAVVQQGGVTAAAAFLSGNPSPDLLVIDLGNSTQPFEELLPLADLCDPNTQVIVLGAVNDLSLYKKFVGAGVADYLVKPATAEDLESALLAAAFRDRAAEDPSAAPKGKLIVSLGARGGVGATTIAVNGAWLLAEGRKRSVGLVDLDLQFGTAALALDLVPSGGMLETLCNPDRVDSLFLSSAMLPKSERLAVMAAEEDLSRDAGFGDEGLDRLLSELRAAYDYVWIDLPRFLCGQHAALLRAANHVFIVSDVSLAGLRDTMRIAKMSGGDSAGGRVGVVLNRVGRDKAMTESQFVKGLEFPVIAKIPEDPKAVEAATAGKLVAQIADKGKFNKELDRFVDTIASRHGAPKKGLSELLGSLRRPA